MKTRLLIIYCAAWIFSLPAAAQVSRTLSSDYGPPESADIWQKFTLPLTAETFGVDEATFSEVLANVSLFRIETEMHTGNDVGGIDQVSIGGRYSAGFEGGNEGWNAAGDGTMEWMSSGGFSGGYIQVSDWASGDIHSVVAPVEWMGDWRGLIGGTIEFYFKTDHPSYKAQVEISNESTNRIILSAEPLQVPRGGQSVVSARFDPPITGEATLMLDSSDDGCLTVQSSVEVVNSAEVQFTVQASPDAGECSSVITASMEGYTDSRITLRVGGDSPTQYGSLAGTVTDATSGEPIANATIVVGEYSTTTNASGEYLFENVPVADIAADFVGSPRTGPVPLTVQFNDLSVLGYSRVVASAEGYFTFEKNVVIKAGELLVLDISLSPEITEDELRVVLNWGETPLDLDLYLKTPLIEGTSYQVAWYSMGSATSPPYAILDNDVQNGFGPETITIHKDYPGTYKCYIHNFSQTPDITTSNAVVQIYDRSGLIHTLYVPDSGSGLYWYLFDLDGASGEITIINTVQDPVPAGRSVYRTKPAVTRVERLMQISSWEWDFENDGTIDATIQNPLYTYEEPGSYTVSLTISDGENRYTKTKANYINATPPADTTPPGPVNDLSAQAVGEDTIFLTWSNPGDADYAGTIIVRKEGSYPANAFDGERVYEGTAENYSDMGLIFGATYYYAAFAYDTSDNLSGLGPTSTAMATAGRIEPQLNVSISSIDATGFPTVKCFTSVVDLESLDPVTGLNSSNFTLKEDGVMQTPVTVEEITTGSDARADIVFVFDITSSMSGEIEGLKNKALNFADALKARGLDVRLALVTFGDDVENIYDFTSDPEQFKEWVDDLYAHGGGDSKENALEALARAAELSFRATTQRIAVLITDADYHEAGESGGGSTSFTTESMIQLLVKNNITNNIVGPDLEQYHQLAENTGGLYFNISSDFQSIINLIGTIISSQYLVTYNTSNSAIDNTWRTVNISVTYNEKGGADQDRYFIGTTISNVSRFRAYAIASDKIVCRWFNPPDTVFAGVRVLRKTDAFPANPGDGTLIYEGPGFSTLDSGLDPAKTYYYAAFAYNYGGFFADPGENARGQATTFASDEPPVTRWTQTISSTTQNLYTVFAVNADRVYAAGEEGTFIRTANGGATPWSVSTTDVDHQLKDLFFVNNFTGLTVGTLYPGSALILKTASSGNSWTRWTSSSDQPLNAITMANDLIGWNVGQNGKIEYTQNGGATWIAQNSTVSVNLHTVSSVSAQTAWCAGDNGTVLKTINSGKSWTPQNPRTSYNLLDIYFINPNNGWATNDHGDILKTRDGGNTWSIANVSDQPLNAVHFSDPLNGCAVGNNGAIFISKDGGDSWNRQTSPINLNLNDVFVTSPLNAWAVGDEGIVVKLSGEPPPSLEGLNVSISSIDAEAFPKIKCFVSVVDDDSRRSLTDLTADEFIVTEDGVAQSPIQVEEVRTGSGARADIVFVFDVTGSMGGQINGLKERALRFADALTEKGIDVRFGLVSFSDEIEGAQDFSSDANEFKTWIDGLTASGGGDSKENALEGLARAAELSFRATTQRIAVLITDADYHEAGESGDGSTSYTTGTMISLLQERSITLNTVGPDLEQYHQLAENTGGLYYDIGRDFTDIVDQIGEILSSQYVVSYTTHDPVPSAEWRDVNITVQRDKVGGSDLGRYSVGSSRLVMDPAEIMGVANSRFKVTIRVQSIINLGLSNFVVSFDPAKIEAVKADEGNFLSLDGASTLFVPEFSNEEGTFEVTITRQMPAGVSGSGVLCELTFQVKTSDCTSNLVFSSINLRNPDNLAIDVTQQGAHITAAETAGILGDFDGDLDIDTRDFALLGTYWKPANLPAGDIGPASGMPPLLEPDPDGVVDFEDLFVFTRMWNWFHHNRTDARGSSLAKPAPSLEWRLVESETETELQLWAGGIERLAMGHVRVRYDLGGGDAPSIAAGTLPGSDGTRVVHLTGDDGACTLDIAFARLP